MTFTFWPLELHRCYFHFWMVHNSSA